MNLRIVICEDEKETRGYLSRLIREQADSFTKKCACEIREYASATECLSDKRRIDLLFLDIELQAPGGGMDGMELARQIRQQEREIQPLIIFVTGYDSYVYDAFDVDAFQYLVKPVEEEKFARVFKRALERIAAGGDHRKKAQTITLKTAGTSRTLPLDQILYIESSNHKAVLHLTDGEFACYAKIKDLEEELRDCFFRIHKGYLVNLSYIEQYSKMEAVLKNGERLLISKYKYRDFTKAYLHFLKKGAGL